MTGLDVDSYLETHYEVVTHLNNTEDIEGTIAWKRRESQGTGGMYELAAELTTEFETKHQDRAWDGDFFDTLEAFLLEKEKEQCIG